MTLVFKSPEEFRAAGFQIPDAETLVGDLRHRELERYLDKLTDTIPEMVNGVRFRDRDYPPLKPRPYQLRYAAMAAMRPVNVFGHEAGTGKTIQAILAFVAIFGWKRFQRGGMLPGMIHILSTPISLELTWLKELTRCGLGDYAQVITNEDELRTSRAPILIYSYDFLKRQTQKGLAMRRAKQYRYKQVDGVWKEYFVGEPMVKLVRKIRKPVMLIADEIHRARWGTDRTEAILALRKGTPWFMGLTGTPLDGWIEHIGAIFAVAYGENSLWWPYTVSGFNKTYTHVTTTGTDYATGHTEGPSRRISAPGVPQHLLPKFYDHVGKLMHRLLFEDREVSPFVEFPEADNQITLIPPDPAHQKAYTDLYLGLRAELENAVSLVRSGKLTRFKARDTVFPILMLLRQMAAHPWELPEGYQHLEQPGSAKLAALVTILEQVQAEGRKAVVFTNFIPTGRKIMAALKTAGIKAHRLYATDTKAKPQTLSRDRRTDIVSDFLDDDSTALVANLRLLAESVTLSEAASVVIHFDHTWESYLWEQGNKRVVRPGQRFDKVPVIDLILEGTIEKYVYDYMRNKLRANQQAVDRNFAASYHDTGDTLSVTELLITAPD